MATTLTRVKIGKPTTEREVLADKCAKLLGYKPLALDAKVPRGPLGSVLAELEIEVLELGRVSKYKSEKRQEELGKIQYYKGLVEAANASRSVVPASVNVPKQYVDIVKLVAGRRDAWLDVDWRMQEIGHYGSPVPEFVLSKAVQVKENFPEAEFFVDYLHAHAFQGDPFLWVAARRGELSSEGTTTLDRLTRNNIEHYCIEVWDEPKFEGKL